MLLKPVLSGSKGAQRNEEVWKIAAVAKLAFDEQETLESYPLCQPEFPAEVVCSQIDARARSEIFWPRC